MQNFRALGAPPPGPQTVPLLRIFGYAPGYRGGTPKIMSNYLSGKYLLIAQKTVAP